LVCVITNLNLPKDIILEDKLKTREKIKPWTFMDRP
jgi:hypothetical protein